MDLFLSSWFMLTATTTFSWRGRKRSFNRDPEDLRNKNLLCLALMLESIKLLLNLQHILCPPRLGRSVFQASDDS